MTETTFVYPYPELNADLLQRTLDHIRTVPEGWNQKAWRKVFTDEDGIATLGPTLCGTAMCFAGEAVHLHEPEAWLINAAVIAEVAQSRDAELTREISYLAEYVLVPGAGHVPVPARIAELRGVSPLAPALTAGQRAMHLLGLTADEADTLFDESNTLTELEAMVAALLRGERSDAALYAARDALYEARDGAG